MGTLGGGNPQEGQGLGKYNFQQEKIPINTHWNIQALNRLLDGYQDREIIQYLEYGSDPVPSEINHRGALQYPKSVNRYLEKQLRKGLVCGPWAYNPFKERVGVSLINTHPKKDSQERHIILDLSWPISRSVNSGIPKETYLGKPTHIRYLSIDNLTHKIFQLGKGCLCFKIDLTGVFRQLGMDPGDYSLLCYVWKGLLFFDPVAAMGITSAPGMCQRMTNAVRYIHNCMGFWLMNYVDGMIGQCMDEFPFTKIYLEGDQS